MNKLILAMLTVIASIPVPAAEATNVTWWVSTTDQTHELNPMPAPAGTPSKRAMKNAIAIDPETTYQTTLGMGSSLDHATCYNLSLLSPADQVSALKRIVSPVDGIGMNLMRICIGTPDFTREPWYSYDDMPAGETDLTLAHFSIEKDRAYVIPIIKLALAQNPDLLIFASPWSPPGWMKDTGTMTGGKLKREYYGVFAEYLVKFVEAYEAEGIPIYAITTQNEPDYGPNTYPSCVYTGEEQRDLIRDHVGPAFQKCGLKTRIWCLDHNFDLQQFPDAVYGDPAASAFVEGTGFHHYEGKVSGMSESHQKWPDKQIFFTEGSVFGLRGANQLIGFFRNWAQSYNAWVTILDENRKPNNGPHSASATCVMIDTKTKQLDYRFDYYLYGHFMKFVARGATRIESSDSKVVPNVAFKNPDGSIVIIATNPATKDLDTALIVGDQKIAVSLPKESVATFVIAR